jgi:hypothetical protein
VWVGEQRMTVPRVPSMGPMSRHWVRGLLATTCPRADDVETVVSHLVGDTVRWCEHEGIILALRTRGRQVRVEVTDQPHYDGTGAPVAVPARVACSADVEAVEAHALGWRLVGELASRWGHDRDDRGVQRVWAELTW